MNDIVIVATGLANVASVAAGLRRAGAEPEITRDPERVRDADGVVLPGVGAFGPGMRELRSEGLDEVLQGRIAAGRPTLGVCLGMQLLFASSDETPGATGLSVVDAHIGRFPPHTRVPQMGWNLVSVSEQNRFIRTGHAYFANSFRATDVPDDWTAAWTEYAGDRFASAITRGDVLACQFHPELSGAWGLALLERWASAALGRTLIGVAPGAPQEARGKACRVIPCLDVKDGRVVKGIRFQGLRDAGDPIEQSTNYERQGADEVVVLDVSATRENRGTRAELIARIREALSVPLTVGGGIRTVEDAQVLLGAGADKVSMNTAAVLRPELLKEVSEELGRQCTVLALDAARTADGWEIVIRAGTERTGINAVTFAREAVELGAGEILLTSWDRDGTGDGYDLELIRAIAEVVDVPIIASGGASDAQHMSAALEAGADAVLAATIFHDGHTTVDEVKSELSDLGAIVRPATRRITEHSGAFLTRSK